MAAALAAAFFARIKPLVWASLWIIISFALSNLWQFVLPQYTFGFALIDLALLTLFYERWSTRRERVLIPLICIQIAFMGFHVGGTVFDFSGVFLGAERSHGWIETWWRNRLFEASNMWIIGASLFKVLMSMSTSAQRIALEVVRGTRRLSNTLSQFLQKIGPGLFPNAGKQQKK